MATTTWFKISETSEHARLSPDIIRGAIRSGDLPSYAPTPGGRDIRLKASDTDAWIESKPYVPPGPS